VKDHGFTDRFVVGLWPPVALVTLGVGLSYLLPAPVDALVGFPLLLVGVVLLPVGAVVMVLPRRWWGPRWYRRLTDEEIRELRLAPDRLTRRMNRRWAEREAAAGRLRQAPAEHRRVAGKVEPGYGTANGGLLGARVVEHGDDPPYLVGRAWREVADWPDGKGDGR